MSTTESPKVKKQKSPFREWLDSVTFAVVAATLIRFFLFEAYTIPTPSMESSLMVGDFLFVSKLHYGVRTPKTPLQVPLTHQKIWFTDIPSYLRWLDLPIYRLPGFTKIKSGDPVVFNVPNYELDGDAPVDLRTFYVKRCIGTPGDIVQVNDQQVFVNGKVMANPERMQHPVFIKTKEVLDEQFFDEFGVRNAPDVYNNLEAADWAPLADSTNQLVGYKVNASQTKVNEILSRLKGATLVKDAFKDPKGLTAPDFFPHDTLNFKWNRDFYGPLKVPSKGLKISLTPSNVSTYGEAIQKYESNKGIQIIGNKIYQEGVLLKEYTFKQDYYFMMGDNRHNSADSRFWGFVPYDHVVGKPVFIWMSLDPNKGFFSGKIRWSRLFRFID